MPRHHHHKRNSKHRKSRSARNTKTKKQIKTRNNRKHKSRSKTSHTNHQHQRGGFTDCSLATVMEPGFTLPALGAASGFSLADSKGVIHRPNCKTDTHQAMVPSS